MNRRDLIKAIASMSLAPSFMSNENQSLKTLASTKNIEFGTAVGNEIFRNSIYRQHVIHHCSILTPENSLKWKSIVSSKKSYDFNDADRLQDFCFNNSIKMRGHALIFEKSMRQWIESCECDLEKELTRFIKTITGRYSSIRSWDVFNEIIDSNGEMGWLRQDIIFQKMGKRYLKEFSDLVLEINPKHEQVLNDWIGPYKGTYFKRRRYSALKMLEYFRTNNIKIGTLGVQSHLLFSKENYDRKEWLLFCSECKNLGFSIKLSEIDLTLGKKPGGFRDEADVAYSVRKYLEDTLSFSNVNSIVTWGLVDSFAYSLSNEQWIGLNYGPSAYTSSYKIGLLGTEIRNALLNSPSFESKI